MGISTWKELKKRRTEHYNKNVYGWKERPCTACNGTGHYDHNGSPLCESCNGTKKEKYRGSKSKDDK